MRMQKRKFRIGELAKHLDIEQFVIRFWEKEFDFKTNRSSGGQRFYSQGDLEKFQKIKEFLYEKGFTIAGAKKQFEHGERSVIASHKTTMVMGDEQSLQAKKELYKKNLEQEVSNQNAKKYSDQLLALRTQLVALKNLL